ncbi:hypothetical protein HMPREF1535_00637 [Parabacteroides goldsteinii DSM 19448 = WAL 12034]|uniref:Uncharacterized protein n=1 Tax=Parabacteroides goldsteinii DSM 19448 = WAL 12034 TaxID=927665 RepID=A0A0F5JMT2_9BACT|nr:hypothetical protein HMPREF1535_00637 [Parabacteroides goldsteinii DSM 19448 = WAL 12034]
MTNILLAFSIPVILLTGALIWSYFIEKESRQAKKKNKK